MNPARWATAKEAVGDLLDGAQLVPVPLLPWRPEVDCDRGVYIAEDALGRVDYVGSACRPDDPGGLAERIVEQCRRLDRRRRWCFVYALPMTRAASLPAVRSAEGRVGALLQPASSLRLPRPVR